MRKLRQAGVLGLTATGLVLAVLLVGERPCRAEGDGPASRPVVVTRTYVVADLMAPAMGRPQSEMLGEIERFITDMVTPEDWRENGGSVSSMRWYGRVLFTSATEEQHQRIAEVLKQLRDARAKDAAIALPTDGLACVVYEVADLAPTDHRAAELAEVVEAVAEASRWHSEGSEEQVDKGCFGGGLVATGVRTPVIVKAFDRRLVVQGRPEIQEKVADLLKQMRAVRPPSTRPGA